MKKLFIVAVLGGVFSTSLVAVNVEALANKVLNKCQTLEACQEAYLTEMVAHEKLKEQKGQKSTNAKKKSQGTKQKKRTYINSSPFDGYC